MIQVYTDAGIRGDLKRAGIGICLVKDGRMMRHWSLEIPFCDSFTAELQAAAYGLSFARRYTDDSEVELIVDNLGIVEMHAIRKSKPKALRAAMGHFRAQWARWESGYLHHIYGHNGDLFNNFADKLAYRASSGRQRDDLHCVYGWFGHDCNQTLWDRCCPIRERCVGGRVQRVVGAGNEQHCRSESDWSSVGDYLCAGAFKGRLSDHTLRFRVRAGRCRPGKPMED